MTKTSIREDFIAALEKCEHRAWMPDILELISKNGCSSLTTNCRKLISELDKFGLLFTVEESKKEGNEVYIILRFCNSYLKWSSFFSSYETELDFDVLNPTEVIKKPIPVVQVYEWEEV